MTASIKDGRLSPDPSGNSRYADEKGRLYFYDNAKFILIFFVVLAHALSPYTEMTDMGGAHNVFMLVWRTINTFHMPCLIFISGFFAKKYISPDKRIKVQRPFTYIVYYLAAQITVGAFEVFVLHNDISKSMLYPRSSLWFLFCLIIWYFILPVIDRIDPRVMMPVAIAVGLLIGYDDKIGNFMSMSRMFTHFPFFLFGYYIRADKMNFLFTEKAKLLSIPAAILALGSQGSIFLLFSTKGPLQFSINDFITCNHSYFEIFEDTGINPLFWLLPRVWFYSCAFLLSFAFLVWVPRSRNIFTRFGSRTLAVYILHRYLYLAYNEYKWYDFGWWNPSWLGWSPNHLAAGIIMVFVAAGLTLLLSTYPCYLPFKLLGKIKINKVLKKD